jgi:hypothetical protein
MGGGKGSSSAPPPIDPGKSMGEYLFGKGLETTKVLQTHGCRNAYWAQKLRIDHNTQH